MKTITDELKEHQLTDAQIKRILTTLERGLTVRTTHSKDIESIFWNDDSNAEVVLANGQSIERKMA